MEQGQHAQAGADHAQTHQPLGRNRLHGEFGEQIAASPQRGAAQQHESGEIRGKVAGPAAAQLAETFDQTHGAPQDS